MSMVISVMDGLRYLLSASTSGLNVYQGILLRLLQEKFGDVFSDNELCVVTTVDPRFKPFETNERWQKAISVTVSAMHCALSPVAMEQPTFTDNAVPTKFGLAQQKLEPKWQHKIPILLIFV